jgi:hypothetical protein
MLDGRVLGDQAVGDLVSVVAADRLEEVRLGPMPQFQLLHLPLHVHRQSVVHREQIHPDRVTTVVRNRSSVENAERRWCAQP